MSATGFTDDSDRIKRASIVVLDIRGLKVPAMKLSLVSMKKLRVNMIGFMAYCDACGGRSMQYHCETEDIYVCNECLGYCHRYAHRWEALSYEKAS